MHTACPGVAETIKWGSPSVESKGPMCWTDETRARRLSQAIEWMAEGKPRHWKYLRR